MRSLPGAQNGFSLTEVLVALTLLGITLGPLILGLTTVVFSVRIRDDITVQSNLTREKMEEVLAMGFTNIPLSDPPGTPNVLSDQVTIGGRTVQRNVIVDLADGDLPSDGIPDAEFKKITIEVGHFEIQSYISANP